MPLKTILIDWSVSYGSLPILSRINNEALRLCWTFTMVTINSSNVLAVVLRDISGISCKELRTERANQPIFEILVSSYPYIVNRAWKPVMKNRFLPVIFGTKDSGSPYFKHILFLLNKNNNLAVLSVKKKVKNRGFTVTGNDVKR